MAGTKQCGLCKSPVTGYNLSNNKTIITISSLKVKYSYLKNFLNIIIFTMIKKITYKIYFTSTNIPPVCDKTMSNL